MPKTTFFRRALETMVAAQEARARTYVKNYMAQHPELASRIGDDALRR
jgi:hypothetical protein